MAKLTEKELTKIRHSIQQFEFKELFQGLGWTINKLDNPNIPTIDKSEFDYWQIAKLGAVVLEIQAQNNQIPDSKTRAILHEKISRHYQEHLLIFVDHKEPQKRRQSCWSWIKRDGKKNHQRSHSYFKGQSGDLLLSKIVNMMVDFHEFDENGNVPIVDVTEKLRNALDIEPITKKFFNEFQKKHDDFVEHITGIHNEKKRAWYASVLLHRLMFIWFLQKKHFLDNRNSNYLNDKLNQIQKTKGQDNYYREFLRPLFFEGFAKPEPDRHADTNKLLGKICYLNGGLFLKHEIEENYSNIQVNDQAFTDLFALFNAYSWNLNDSLDGADNEINPDVLGYIFEKYINQKAFGAYYTRSEITDYLCERTIHQLILDRVNYLNPVHPELVEGCGSTVQQSPRTEFKDLPDLLFNCDADLCYALLTKVLPSISLLDPACGSGAFLVAAMKTLIGIYQALIEKAMNVGGQALPDLQAKLALPLELKQWLDNVNQHPSRDYFIKKQIITDNLYGVDIMPEATEIAKLRLFLALVSSAQKADELEPLPNIDFNIMAGNSLIGLRHIDEKQFNQNNIGKTGDIFAEFAEKQTYQDILTDKNKSIALYKKHGNDKTEHEGILTQNNRLLQLRDHVSKVREKSYKVLNNLLLNKFERLQIKYEQATWDESKNKAGKAIKRALTLEDIKVLQPFHWGYEFDQIFARGGFDAIITNPPWEVLKPQAKEFFADYSDLVTKNKMTIKDFEKEQGVLLANPEIRSAWLNYQSRFSFVSLYFRTSAQYPHQTAVVNGKKTGSDINLYKLFTEQCFNLLKNNGECGIVIPSGIYTDLGATGLRQLLFNETNITGLFCFENRKIIFEGVDSRFKFVVLTFVKAVGAIPCGRPFVQYSETGQPQGTAPTVQSFPVAFMRHDVNELTLFPNEDSLHISTDLIKKLSPDSLSIMEFKNEMDVHIAEKMLKFPLLGETLENTWNLKLCNEFHMTNDSHLFKTENAKGRLPLYEGKMIHQFSSTWGEPKYWLDETEARKALLGKNEDIGQVLDYQGYRLAFRDVAASTNERTMIATILPPHLFCPHTMSLENVTESKIKQETRLFLVALFNSFVIDSLIRQRVTSHVSFFFVYNLPIPRLTEQDPLFKAIVERAAALICTTPEFDDLKTDLLESKLMSLDSDKQQIRAELDAIIAHIYGLTEQEFEHILKTFPIVKDEIKQAALAEFKKLSIKLVPNFLRL